MSVFTSLLFIIHIKLATCIHRVDVLVVIAWGLCTFIPYYAYIAITDTWVHWDHSHFTFEFLYSTPLFYFTNFLTISICYLANLAITFSTHEWGGDPRDLLYR